MRYDSPQLLPLVAAMVLGGCDRSDLQRVPVAGTVRIDGRPLSSGVVRFVPESGRPVSGKVLQDGKFELAAESVDQVRQRGAPVGQYRIQVSAAKIVNDQVIDWNVPERYADFRTSGLQVAIDKPQDNLLIDLTWYDSKTSEPITESGSASQNSIKRNPATLPAMQSAAEVTQP